MPNQEIPDNLERILEHEASQRRIYGVSSSLAVEGIAVPITIIKKAVARCQRITPPQRKT